MVLSTAFFPPVSWFCAASRDFTLSPDRVFPSVVWLEKCETFHKQTYRNRCRILTANGVESLSFPIVHDGDYGIGKVKVDYSVPWVDKMKKAVDSAYFSSPYFEYYRDDLYSILDERPERLWDLNLSIIAFFLKACSLAVELRPTTLFHLPLRPSPYGEDLREVIHPKRDNTIISDLGLDKAYYQVFRDRFPFVSDLSIMDLLFNEGPDSILFLKKLP